jgi:hypothetical protein
MAHHYEHFYLDPKFWVAVSFVIFLLLVGRMAWAKLTGMLGTGVRRRCGRIWPRPHGCGPRRRRC